MARDNHPKERHRRGLERKTGQRASYDRIRIVSEGSTTEPNYFNAIRWAERLHTVHVGVQPREHRAEPIQVVEHAKKLSESGNGDKGIQPGARATQRAPTNVLTPWPPWGKEALAFERV